MASWLNEDFDDDEEDDLSYSDSDSDEELEFDDDDSYDSADSDAEFLDEQDRAEVQENANVALLSKDKTIQYSLEPPPTARPPASRVCVIANEGNFFSSRI